MLFFIIMQNIIGTKSKKDFHWVKKRKEHNHLSSVGLVSFVWWIWLCTSAGLLWYSVASSRPSFEEKPNCSSCDSFLLQRIVSGRLPAFHISSSLAFQICGRLTREPVKYIFYHKTDGIMIFYVDFFLILDDVNLHVFGSQSEKFKYMFIN